MASRVTPPLPRTTDKVDTWLRFCAVANVNATPAPMLLASLKLTAAPVALVKHRYARSLNCDRPGGGYIGTSFDGRAIDRIVQVEPHDAATPTLLEFVLEFDCELLLPLDIKLLILGNELEPPLLGVELRCLIGFIVR